MRYSAEDRKRLIHEQVQSGLTKRDFCAQRQINLATFYNWPTRKLVAGQVPAFAQVDIATGLQAAVEVLLPNGARVGIRHQGRRDELVCLIRGVCGYAGGAAC